MRDLINARFAETIGLVELAQFWHIFHLSSRGWFLGADPGWCISLDSRTVVNLLSLLETWEIDFQPLMEGALAEL